MIPALKEIMATLPFLVQGFLADNDSEFINQTVAKLLNKLTIEFTNYAHAIPMTMRWLSPRMVL